ncbi:hypothetical protein OSO01_33210 [Oceanobacillus sojae]|uniref:Uncharacterized protein n=1 Tax=Oceanobacillus sojae TaxID=582851 RepID=A0A511ZMA0_9BACI|nr:hypothetical protein OSO01_33210 [Oceanobacillus sojae]
MVLKKHVVLLSSQNVNIVVISMFMALLIYLGSAFLFAMRAETGARFTASKGKENTITISPVL